MSTPALARKSRKRDEIPATRGISRMVSVLDYIHDKDAPVSLIEIASDLGAPRSTIYEIAKVLLNSQMLQKQGDGKVFLGSKFMYYGEVHKRHVSVLKHGQQIMQKLTNLTGEASQICMRAGRPGNKYVIAMMEPGTRYFRLSAKVGTLLPLPWTAAGRLLVSHLPPEDILELIPEEDFMLPTHKRLPPEVFLEEVAAAAEAGLWHCDSLLDNFCHCFAAPVYNSRQECEAALCLVLVRSEVQGRREQLSEALRSSAEELSLIVCG